MPFPLISYPEERPVYTNSRCSNGYLFFYPGLVYHRNLAASTRVRSSAIFALENSE